jgi:enolase
VGGKMDREVIRVIDGDDTALDVELISILESDNNKYLIYSKGERQKSGNLVLYISKLVAKDEKYYLENIHSDDEWANVKTLLGKIISK